MTMAVRAVPAVLGAFILSIAPATTSPSTATESDCVSRGEIARVEVGWTRWRAHRVLGSTGQVVPGSRRVTVVEGPGGQTTTTRRHRRNYYPCAAATITVWFEQVVVDGGAAPYRVRGKAFHKGVSQ